MLMNWTMSLDAGGARRNRTDDLFNAIEALSQLSYGPDLQKTSRPDGGEARLTFRGRRYNRKLAASTRAVVQKSRDPRRTPPPAGGRSPTSLRFPRRERYRRR